MIVTFEPVSADSDALMVRPADVVDGCQYTRSGRVDVKVWVPFRLPTHSFTPQNTVDPADGRVRQASGLIPFPP